MADEVDCPSCGAANPSANAYCRSCFAQLQAPPWAGQPTAGVPEPPPPAAPAQATTPQAEIDRLEQLLSVNQDASDGKRSPQRADMHRQLGDAYAANGQLDQALVELDRAFRIHPGSVLVLTRLGEVALEVGDVAKAQQAFRSLLLQPLDDSSPLTKAEVFARLGEVHLRQGDNAKAKAMLTRALQADPNLQSAKRLAAKL